MGTIFLIFLRCLTGWLALCVFVRCWVLRPSRSWREWLPVLGWMAALAVCFSTTLLAPDVGAVVCYSLKTFHVELVSTIPTQPSQHSSPATMSGYIPCLVSPRQ